MSVIKEEQHHAKFSNFNFKRQQSSGFIQSSGAKNKDRVN